MSARSRALADVPADWFQIVATTCPDCGRTTRTRRRVDGLLQPAPTVEVPAELHLEQQHLVCPAPQGGAR